MRLLPIACLALLAGCANQRAEKMSFAEAFGPSIEPAPAPAAPRVRPKPKRARPRVAALQWPIEPVRVTSVFGDRLHPVLGVSRLHAGVDLAALPDQLVTAAGVGSVAYAGWNGAHGRHVEIQHPGGVVTRYSHLSLLLVEVGTTVQPGDPVGLAGASGVATGVHLHFEVLKRGQPVDPLEVLGPVTEGEPVASW